MGHKDRTPLEQNQQSTTRLPTRVVLYMAERGNKSERMEHLHTLASVDSEAETRESALSGSGDTVP